MEHLTGFTAEELRAWFAKRDIPSYRADQVLRWVYRETAQDFSRMSNLSKDLRETLQSEFSIRQAKCLSRRAAPDGTLKLLLAWPDGAMTETVLISSGPRRTVCISSQVGCAAKCLFCASGKEGLERSLEAGQMVEQVLWAAGELSPGERISHVVVMGMGEPLMNYENTLKAATILNAEWGMGIAARHITISTVGIPDKIRRLANEPIQITLAVSLHAGEDALRSRLIPWAKQYKLADLFDAIGYYFHETHREVTLEYILLHDVNDRREDAEHLIRWCRVHRCNVNVINYNPVEHAEFQPAERARVEQFINWLEEGGVNVHLRRSAGGPIDAACGQLRLRKRKT